MTPGPGTGATRGRPASDSSLAGLYVVTLFASAGLLFCVQPMVARMVLPALGGSPAVWNTCMVFFQAALLAGYAYAHLLAARAGLRAQAVIHSLVVLTPLLVLPIGLGAGGSAGPPREGSPVPWLLWTLSAAVGLPFFVVAATAPLLQRWYAAAGGRSSADPYFLYAASNSGSMAALLGYPLLIEPGVRLAWQSRLWGVGYAGLAALVVACGAAAARRCGSGSAGASDEGPCPRVGFRRWSRWVGLAFLPSSLMLGVTSYISTDVAAVPLLWVAPLALYLLTFILVFSRRVWFSREAAAGLMPAAVMMLAWTLAVGSEPRLSLMALHLATYFLVALVCHGGLADDRPAARQLTGFYLAMSVGGVLGGLFNALLAPLVFDRVVEYPLALGLSCLALPAAGAAAGGGRGRGGRALAAALGLALAGVCAGRLAGVEGPIAGGLTKLAGGLAAVLGLVRFGRRPAGLAAVCLALLFTGFLPAAGGGARVLWRGRDFFGVLTVTENDGALGRDHRLVHGRTLHGRQNLAASTRGEPLTYYHRTGPVGDLFRAADARGRAVEGGVGVVGLGAGSMAAYARPGERWTFYEIDPAVARVARDPRYFTFLSGSRAGSLGVVLGDARLRLREAPGRGYRLLVLDAFSSDAIPVHLLTREALALYRAKLAGGGLIAFHISNRYIDLGPVLAALARDAGLVCRVRADLAVTPAEEAAGKSASVWAVMAAREADLGPIAGDPRWAAPRPSPGAVWADDFSDVASHLLGWK